jgi:hypothetical protein
VDPNSAGYCEDGVCYRPVQSQTFNQGDTYSFTFDAVGYEETCEVRVVALGPNCDSDPDWSKCDTYFDCPEVPDLTCDIGWNTPFSRQQLDFSWDTPTVGTLSHAENWHITAYTTVPGPKLCERPDGLEITCASYIPTYGLEACDETFEDACGDAPSEGDGPAKTRLGEICQLECAMYESLSNLVEGVVDEDENFVKGAGGSASCAANSLDALTEEECQSDACPALGGTWDGIRNWNYVAPGCFSFGSLCRWNVDSTGVGGDPRYAPICHE